MGLDPESLLPIRGFEYGDLVREAFGHPHVAPVKTLGPVFARADERPTLEREMQGHRPFGAQVQIPPSNRLGLAR